MSISNNIGQLAADLTVKNTSAVFNEVLTLITVDGVLDGHSTALGTAESGKADAFPMSICKRVTHWQRSLHRRLREDWS